MSVKVKTSMVETTSGRSLEARLDDIISVADYGASSTATLAENINAINLAIVAAAAGSGIVFIPQGIAYTESGLNIPDNVVILQIGALGTCTFLTKYQGTALPVTKGGVVIKGQGNTGILLRALDYGVTAEPILQILDAAAGDVAALAPKFLEMDEITAPTSPSANKVRMFTRDNGSGKTQLVALFPTGAVQVIATEP